MQQSLFPPYGVQPPTQASWQFNQTGRLGQHDGLEKNSCGSSHWERGRGARNETIGVRKTNTTREKEAGKYLSGKEEVKKKQTGLYCGICKLLFRTITIPYYIHSFSLHIQEHVPVLLLYRRAMKKY